jgi:16S rRNA C967 or C1407 C5-methylase (RsmB/RsmF family)/NOL1/NOP2/fmu family ribosome biogenesis protein
MNLSDDFVNQIKGFLPEADANHLINSLDKPAPVSIRINSGKWNTILPDENIPWCPSGFYMKSRPVFTLDPSFHAGAYYVQEPSSMFVHHVLEAFSPNEKNIRILDLCASPGGKSTLIASWLGGNGLLIANEIIKSRAYTLKYNLLKEGCANVIVTNNDPQDFHHIREYFDIILVDAPCSGEGMFRKDPESICEWSLENVDKCASRQKRILSNIIPALKPGGILIYSTCTYNRKENIENTDWIAGNMGLINLALEIPSMWQIDEIHGKNSVGYQFYPHKIKGEGFFISVFKKDEGPSQLIANNKKKSGTLTKIDKNETAVITQWVRTSNLSFLKDKTGTIHAFPDEFEKDAYYLEAYLRLIYCGVTVGDVNKNILIPNHSLALSKILIQDFPTISLDLESARFYLKKTLPCIESRTRSWMLASYQNNNIGFLKNLGNRINNYLPNEYRILMDLPEIKT